MVVAFGSYLTVQTITENNVRQALLEQQKQRQIDTVNSLSSRISSDIDSIAVRMMLLAAEPSIQNGDFTDDAVTLLLKKHFKEISEIALVEAVNIVDTDNKVANTGEDDQRHFIGSDVSDREYLQGVRDTGQPYVSGSYIALTGNRAFAIAVPIINRESGQNVGTIVARFVVPDFFKAYQEDIQPSNIVAFDRGQVYISTTVPAFLGQYFWGDNVQSAIGSKTLNAAYRKLFSGSPASTLFISGVTHDERFVAGSPVFFGGNQVMTVLITTPTAAIYSQVNDILFAQKIQIIASLSAVVAAISVLILYLSRWNRALDEKVKQRTAELETAKAKLETSNSMQKEFINIAAHELRTPIQPLLGVAEMMDSSLDSKDKVEVGREEVEMLVRNAKRLERLSSDILVVSRIESGNMELHKEPVNLINKLGQVARDMQSSVADKDVKIVFDQQVARSLTSGGEILVDADRTKLFEVLSNLVRNSIKFTEKGTIGISVAKSNDGRFAIVKIKDTGKGIDPEIMPKLFSKFVSKSESGTGIGLFISKSIVEAHGGQIWAENNQDGSGATFTFTLPLTSTD